MGANGSLESVHLASRSRLYAVEGLGFVWALTSSPTSQGFQLHYPILGQPQPSFQGDFGVRAFDVEGPWGAFR